MYILGINAYHGDSSACLVLDGRLIAAAEEERFRRIKHWAGFPSEAIKYVLAEAGISLDQVDRLAINTDPKANILKKIGFALAKKPDLKLILDRIKNAKERMSLDDELAAAFPGQKFRGSFCHVEHHLAHLSSSYLVSPFDEAVLVSVDGFGDFSSAAWGLGTGAKIEKAGQVYFPHSLGIFYQALTQYLGFPHYGDEYKVMGLAPYGEPLFLDEMRQIVHLQDDGGFRLNLEYFRHHKEKIDYEWENGEPRVGKLYSEKLKGLLGDPRDSKGEMTQRYRNVARSVQAMYEEAFFHLLNHLHQQYSIDSLALAGGCAMNSVANGKIYRETPFKNCYIQSAAGDAGGAIGAAYFVWHQEANKARSFYMDHSYWGPSYSSNDIKALLESSSDALEQAGCRFELIEDEAELCGFTAEALAGGNVVGWFQGRMEWGPRALGNRSILGDPRRADMKDILNRKIKRRESFRPFAPSIVREAVPQWFETDDDVPFMMQVFQIREERRDAIPAVTHVDGSGRLQTVSKATNPRYHRLIMEFANRTDVPMVLNTSFNENEPVVCKPEEALDCFLRTKMDLLVMENWMVRRVSPP